MRYYNISVDNTKGLYTYMDENDEFEIGQRVEVSFRNKKRTGLIVSVYIKEIDFKVLPIQKLVENSFVLTKTYIRLLIWISNYYMCDFSEVLNAAIPSGLSIQYEKTYTILDIAKIRNIDILSQKEIDYLDSRFCVTRPTLIKHFGKELIDILISEKYLRKDGNNIYLENTSNLENNLKCDKIDMYYNERRKIRENTFIQKISKKSINYLMKNNLISFAKEIVKKNEIKTEEIPDDIRNNSTKLNLEQEKARDTIINSNDKYFLIKGVTGSGKTEVYISIIKEAFKNGKGSIFLVPEISLTPQMIKRFKGEFKENIAILHSQLTQKERAQEWYNIYSGNKKIVLGVRSAIFAPVQDLEYIILDEEHENTYKQDSNPRYNAKQVAIMRGNFENAKVILGSATPSIETYYHAKCGKLKLIEMNKRYNNAKMPSINLVDMTKVNDLYFSPELLEEIRKRLIRKEQILLLLNRKGYSTYIECRDCGHTEECPHCSIKYSYYSSLGILKCNYCGDTHKYTGRCSKCGSKNLYHSGKGVERIEEEIKKYFDAKVVRVDSEISRDRNYFNKVYFDFLDKKYDIMIGTQLISKGLHFPDVTLVGVINADTILNFPDFRAGEKTFQLMLQVAGRAGREEKEGLVLIQTYQSENLIFKKIKEDDYIGFYNYEINNRELLEYPPFSKVINIGLSSKYEKYLEDFSKYFMEDIKYDKVEMYGPNKSLVYKVKNRYRYNIFIKGSKKEINIFKKILKLKLTGYENETKVRITIDIDPINLI